MFNVQRCAIHSLHLRSIDAFRCAGDIAVRLSPCRPIAAISSDNYINKTRSFHTNGQQHHSMLLATVRLQCINSSGIVSFLIYTDMSNRIHLKMLDYSQKFNRWCFSVREYLLNRNHLASSFGGSLIVRAVQSKHSEIVWIENNIVVMV